ncbi:aminoglycoside 3-N-acetyltransferase [Bacillus sp. FJAT-27231]|uniref:aminoglycoside N(3)-acetyltransferase n=1 Tax=Bacillus sp. FJAT-27231 TaxID=1679168 RepID=UPI000670F01E|nr:AAC(3) family N-acetyltransferase [Bacillus sp. FJAT-27231]KMY53027.1 aminoglycoside 3-N-acetyltransferase [Bacillus sp. FJAT-27231]
MTGSHLVRQTTSLITTETLKKDLHSLGVMPDTVLMVHSSLRSLGWIAGGEITVIQALMAAVTDNGTIVMPTQTTHNSDPKYWQNPPVPEEWWPGIRYFMPAYLPDITPTIGMGRIAEAFRTFPDVKRSLHPSASFAAWGKYASFIIDNHSINFAFGEQSPLARLYDLDASILFIGTDYSTCTAMHLGEFRANDGRKAFKQGSAMMENGERVWKTYMELEENSEQFNDIGRAFEKEAAVTNGMVAQSPCKLIQIRPLVDFTSRYLTNLSKQ